MEASDFQIHSRNLYMNSFPFKVKSIFSFNSGSNFSPFCTYSLSLIPANILIKTLKLPEKGGRRVVRKAVKAPDTAALKEGWLDSLSCPIAGRARLEEDSAEVNAGPNWVIGIDPDISGALALLKTDDSGCTAQVFDVPHLTVPVGKRLRKRLDARSMVEIVRSLEAPWGSTAYIEQSLPFPQDGKQGWWSGGFGYGLWIGILVASGFTVVPVPSLLWKNEFGIAGGRFSKDDSRRVASTLFPLLGDQLKRKKDHGRADALLIAAYGNGTKLKPSLEELAP